MLPMRRRRSVYLFDTVVLSNFALAGRLDLLVTRYGKAVMITLEVLDEVTDGVVAGYSALREIEDAWDTGRFSRAEALADKDERATYRELLRTLAPGEASCIACAGPCAGIVVTDDRTARQCCAGRGIPFTGTIGILIACCADGILSADDADATVVDRGVVVGGEAGELAVELDHQQLVALERALDPAGV